MNTPEEREFWFRGDQAGGYQAPEQRQPGGSRSAQPDPLTGPLPPVESDVRASLAEAQEEAARREAARLEQERAAALEAPEEPYLPAVRRQHAERLPRYAGPAPGSPAAPGPGDAPSSGGPAAIGYESSTNALPTVPAPVSGQPAAIGGPEVAPPGPRPEAAATSPAPMGGLDQLGAAGPTGPTGGPDPMGLSAPGNAAGPTGSSPSPAGPMGGSPSPAGAPSGVLHGTAPGHPGPVPGRPGHVPGHPGPAPAQPGPAYDSEPGIPASLQPMLTRDDPAYAQHTEPIARGGTYGSRGVPGQPSAPGVAPHGPPTPARATKPAVVAAVVLATLLAVVPSVLLLYDAVLRSERISAPGAVGGTLMLIGLPMLAAGLGPLVGGGLGEVRDGARALLRPPLAYLLVGLVLLLAAGLAVG